MNRRAWRLLIPPAVLPLALWVFVTVAGPGGVVEFDDGSESATVAGETDSDAVQPADADADDSQETVTGTDVDADGTSQASSDQATSDQATSDQPSPAPSTTDPLPGKSEDAPGEPAADPQLPAASDQGQQTAEANGNGPADAPGQNP